VSTGLSAIICTSEVAAHQDAIVTQNRTVSWRELLGHVSAERGYQSELAKHRVALIFQPKIASYAIVFL